MSKSFFFVFFINLLCKSFLLKKSIIYIVVAIKRIQRIVLELLDVENEKVREREREKMCKYSQFSLKIKAIYFNILKTLIAFFVD